MDLYCQKEGAGPRGRPGSAGLLRCIFRISGDTVICAKQKSSSRRALFSLSISLRYKYLTAIYKGHFYDIELANNSNDNVCGASLDNFSKSLKFIDTKDAKE